MSHIHWVVRQNQKSVYYESIKRELKTRPIYECRCDERLEPESFIVVYYIIKKSFIIDLNQVSDFLFSFSFFSFSNQCCTNTVLLPWSILGRRL
jgi:hypothetical protein